MRALLLSACLLATPLVAQENLHHEGGADITSAQKSGQSAKQTFAQITPKAGSEPIATYAAA